MNYQQQLLNAFPDLAKFWDEEIIPTLQDFITIPNQSPFFDPDWETQGYMQQAVELIRSWCQRQPIKGMEIKVFQDKGHTPLLFIDIKGQIEAEPILLYGHLDKQPPMRGWTEGLGPWNPVLKDGKLYGRGAADDGYSVFSAIAAIAFLQKLNIPHAECILLIEASEESGSIDLPHYLQQLYSQFTAPNLVIGLDSGCGNYEQLWSTTSLRGIINGMLNIRTLTQGVHSGAAGGVVPSVFTVLRLLLDRIEDSATSKIRVPELNSSVPDQQLHHANILAKAQESESINTHFPFANATLPLSSNRAELILNQTWHPALAVTGLEGLPNPTRAGNVIIPNLSVKLSMRIPPNLDPKPGVAALKRILETNPPYQAEVSYIPEEANAGWLAPSLSPWLAEANEQASQLFFNKPAMYMGEGGTIPFMGMLGAKFPQAQFLITGVLGPFSNAHGPNEFLHINMAKNLTACIAFIIAAHYQFHFSS